MSVRLEVVNKDSLTENIKDLFLINNSYISLFSQLSLVVDSQELHLKSSITRKHQFSFKNTDKWSSN